MNDITTTKQEMPNKARPIALTVSAVAAVAVIAFCCWAALAFGYTPRITETLAQIDVGKGRLVSIHAALVWEQARPIYYNVREGWRLIVTQASAGYDLGADQYTLKYVSAENQTLVGIFDPNKPVDKLFILIDFKNGAVWPLSIPTAEEYDEARQKAIDMFDRLQKENPDLTRPGNLAH